MTGTRGKLVVATNNPGKMGEIRAILEHAGVEVVSSAAFPGVPEVVEDGATFEENALKKAVTVARATGEVALADDSGLEVDVLGGMPGVRSARFAGEDLSRGVLRDRANVGKLLALLEGVPETRRAARFRCVVAIADPEGRVGTVEGVCTGRIAATSSGSYGFGYDPVFIPDGYDASFAELGPGVKNQVSHRARALRAAVPVIMDFLTRRATQAWRSGCVDAP